MTARALLAALLLLPALALAANPREGRTWCYAPHQQLTHATIYHSVSPEALQYLFPTPVEQDPQSGFDIACQSPRS